MSILLIEETNEQRKEINNMFNFIYLLLEMIKLEKKILKVKK